MSMYQFVKDNRKTGGPKRLFIQGTAGSTNNSGSALVVRDLNGVESLQAVVTKRRLSTEVLGSSIESTKTSQRAEDGTRRITTRIVRKVTTLTRGEEKSTADELLHRGGTQTVIQREEYAESTRGARPKRVKVLFRLFSHFQCVGTTFCLGYHKNRSNINGRAGVCVTTLANRLHMQ